MRSETAALVAYAAESPVHMRVTATEEQRPGDASCHDPDKLSCWAIDVDSGVAGDDPQDAMLTIFDEWLLVEGDLDDLIYAHAPFNLNAGRRVAAAGKPGSPFTGHRDHIHVSVRAGVHVTYPGRSLMALTADEQRELLDKVRKIDDTLHSPVPQHRSDGNLPYLVAQTNHWTKMLWEKLVRG